MIISAGASNLGAFFVASLLISMWRCGNFLNAIALGGDFFGGIGIGGCVKMV